MNLHELHHNIIILLSTLKLILFPTHSSGSNPLLEDCQFPRSCFIPKKRSFVARFRLRLILTRQRGNLEIGLCVVPQWHHCCRNEFEGSVKES